MRVLIVAVLSAVIGRLSATGGTSVKARESSRAVHRLLPRYVEFEPLRIATQIILSNTTDKQVGGGV